MKKNPIAPTIPFDRDGIHHGFLRLPYSCDDSAWGSIMIPITVIRNGDGPTALLTGGNHGDEYEGPVALQEMTVTLKPEDITGRVIIVPAFNYPAFRAGRRTSPLDTRAHASRHRAENLPHPADVNTVPVTWQKRKHMRTETVPGSAPCTQCTVTLALNEA